MTNEKNDHDPLQTVLVNGCVDCRLFSDRNDSLCYGTEIPSDTEFNDWIGTEKQYPDWCPLKTTDIGIALDDDSKDWKGTAVYNKSRSDLKTMLDDDEKTAEHKSNEPPQHVKFRPTDEVDEDLEYVMRWDCYVQCDFTDGAYIGSIKNGKFISAIQHLKGKWRPFPLTEGMTYDINRRMETIRRTKEIFDELLRKEKS